MELPTSEADAAWIAKQRELLPLSIGTAEIRDLIPAEIRARAVFTARGTNAVFLSMLKKVIDALANGDLDEASARWVLLQILRALGYTPEGGFPDDAPGTVPPALAGSLQDLSSFKRLDLIVRTQRQLMAGAGEQFRGHTPDRLEAAPAWELVRILPRMAPRNWNGRYPSRSEPQSRWTIAGGVFYGGRMIAFKGDPVWGELGSSSNFDDALDVDYPPFAFTSGMGWREVPRAECKALKVRGPNGETIDEWFATRPKTLRGELPMPSPSLSLNDVDPDLADAVTTSTGATDATSKPGIVDYSDLLGASQRKAADAYQKRNPNYRPSL